MVWSRILDAERVTDFGGFGGVLGSIERPEGIGCGGAQPTKKPQQRAPGLCQPHGNWIISLGLTVRMPIIAERSLYMCFQM